jgi:hypothetical protein
VLRIESYLMRLLKAVFISISVKQFDRSLDSTNLKVTSSEKEPPFRRDSYAALAAADSIKCEIVLSMSLGKLNKYIVNILLVPIDTTWLENLLSIMRA